ncbi:AAA family ATPase [bacterium]|nr:AAA family ATPase [bacterium]
MPEKPKPTPEEFTEKIGEEVKGLPAGEKELPYPVEEQAQQLWNLWVDYARLQAKISRNLRKEKQPKREDKGQKETPVSYTTPAEQEAHKTEKISYFDLKPELEKRLSQDPEAKRIREKIAERWKNPGVQKAFLYLLRRREEERIKIKPSLEEYRSREKELKNLQRKEEDLLKYIFCTRDQEPREVDQIELAELRAQISALREKLKEMVEKNPELAAFVQYSKLREYQRQYCRTGFIWSPSRERLFRAILYNLVIVNQNRPLLLVGDSGTGKTRLARQTALRLTDKPCYEAGEEARDRIQPLLGSAEIDQEGSFVRYGPLGQALTGKKTSRDKKAGEGGIFYLDEFNTYPPSALRALVKQISGKRPGEEVTFSAWRGHSEKIAPKFAFIGSCNLPSEKHPDRPHMPVEVERELIAILEVDYPEQSVENPELYEMMLAVLLDPTGELRLQEGEVEPEWIEEVDPTTQEKKEVVNEDPKAGGTLWRFANLVRELQKSYRGEENVLTPARGDDSYLERAIIDIGRVLAWLREFQISQRLSGITLKEFLQSKLAEWASQPTLPPEDRELIKEFCEAYGFSLDPSAPQERDAKGPKLWTQKEIGFLSPRVPRPSQRAEELSPTEGVTFLPDGTEIHYTPSPELAETLLQIQGKEWRLLGTTEEGKYVLEEMGGAEVLLLSEEELHSHRLESAIAEIIDAVKSQPEEQREELLEHLLQDQLSNLSQKEQTEFRQKLQQALKKENWKALQKMILSLVQ